MQVYAILLNTETPKVRDLVGEHFPDHYPFSRDVYFVKTKSSTVDHIARLVGIYGEKEDEDDEEGIVFRLSSFHSGYGDSSLWEWLNDAFKGVE
ncbi:MAG: hypothetical protein OXC69_02840 [Candidatus Tectomicrobia bacterium]|nr:hypothetical protein [Candidatus Tectomicrobia bacterium]